MKIAHAIYAAIAGAIASVVDWLLRGLDW